jgi:diguanylate cyclase (GGDEF)-like protein
MLSIDRQEKQLKYDHALTAFMLYFISDSIWAGVDSGLFPVNRFTVVITDFSNYVLMTAITYTWLRYVMVVEQIPNRDTKAMKAWLTIPFLVSVVVFIVTFIVRPSLLIDDDLKTTNLFDVYLVAMSYVYIIAVIIYTVRKAISEKNPIEKRKHLYIGLFPIMTVAGGLMQMILMPELPIFCFSSTILMIIFYIQSMERQISIDPLTKLNNRGQLTRYVSQSYNLNREGRSTFVMMVDINDFKMINDTYGHAEGDCALVIIARSLMKTLRNYDFPMFLGRYGGDEFVMIVHPVEEEEIKELVNDIRECIRKECESDNKPYLLSIGIGYDEYLGDQDTFQKCMQRADSKLYLDKEYCKINGKSTLCS